MSYSSYQRRSYDFRGEQQNSSKNHEVPPTFDFRPGHLVSTSPIGKDNQSKNRWTSHQKTYQYDIGQQGRPKTPSSHNQNYQYKGYDNSINQQSFKRITRNFQPRTQTNKYMEISHDQLNVGNKNQNKRVYISDTNQSYGKRYDQTDNVMKNHQKKNYQEIQNDHQKYQNKQNLYGGQIKQSISKNYQRINRNKPQKQIKNQQPLKQFDKNYGDNQRQIIKKINRINQLNQQINSRLQRMLQKINNNNQ